MAITYFEVTPPLEHEVCQRLAGQIKPNLVPIEVKLASRRKPLGNCYWNVADVVQNNGGQIVAGWLLSWRPQLYGVAMHHAIWRHPDGRLIDVTEPYPSNKGIGHSVFVMDERHEVTLDRPPYVPDLFWIIRDDPAVIDYCNLHLRKRAILDHYAQVAWEVGYRCEQQFALAATGKPVLNNQRAVPKPAAMRMQSLMADVAEVDQAIQLALKRISQISLGE